MAHLAKTNKNFTPIFGALIIGSSFSGGRPIVGLQRSWREFYVYYTYAQIKGALVTDAKSADDVTAVADAGFKLIFDLDDSMKAAHVRRRSRVHLGNIG